MRHSKEIAAAIKLLKKNRFRITDPPPESEHKKATRTGVKPAIWPPIVMTRENLNHFRHVAAAIAVVNEKAQNTRTERPPTKTL